MSQDLDAFGIPIPVALPGVLSAVGGPNDTFNGIMYAHASTSSLPLVAQSSTGNSLLDAAAARQNATEEEMEDDEAEWPIREAAVTSPPAWAKRKLAEDDLINMQAKRPRNK